MIAARNITRSELGLFYGFAAFSLASILLAFTLNMTFMLALPALLLVVFFTALNYKGFYFVLMAMLPCSIEYYFSCNLKLWHSA